MQKNNTKYDLIWQKNQQSLIKMLTRFVKFEKHMVEKLQKYKYTPWLKCVYVCVHPKRGNG